MEHAIYGAIKIGECLGDHFSSFIGCESNELQYFDSKCSGLKSCEVVIPVPELQSHLQCLPKGLVPYLEASYSCLAGNLIMLFNQFCMYYIYTHI